MMNDRYDSKYSLHKQKKSSRPPLIGSSSLLVIFAVLCLVVFTLLAISTVQADRRLADHSIRAISDYYEADLQAETILALLRQGKLPEGVSVKENLYSYSCPICDTQELQVTVRQDQKLWTVLRWQAVSTMQ